MYLCIIYHKKCNNYKLINCCRLAGAPRREPFPPRQGVVPATLYPRGTRLRPSPDTALLIDILNTKQMVGRGEGGRAGAKAGPDPGEIDWSKLQITPSAKQ